MDMYLSNSILMRRGWAFLAAWLHRISGIVLVLYVWFHVFTLNNLHYPEIFDSEMKIFQSIYFIVLEYLLAIPVIYHSLNGGRLILYEIYENRDDDLLLRWVFGLSIIYLSLLAFFMIIANQAVSAVFFWGYVIVLAVCLSYATVKKAKSSGASKLWKLQRITGSYLLLVIPAHMIFTHLSPSVGHDAYTIIARMNNIFVKFVDFTLLACSLYHGAYGLYSISRDYFKSSGFKIVSIAVLICITLIFSWIGLKLIVFI